MELRRPLAIRNGDSAAVADVPVLGFGDFRRPLLEEGARLVSLSGRRASQGRTRLTAVVAQGGSGSLGVLATDVGEGFPSLTPDLPEAHLFEREVFEQTGARPEGHPWLKPVRFASGEVGVADFFRVEGEEVHEVAVGPVHAGVIEPGHFRFQCHGEVVHHLEISLGYQHRGVERAILGGPDKRTIHLVETLAGDTTVGHASAYCAIVEALSGARVPARAHALRAVALELERLANHTGGLGALANDVGYLPSASFCGRLRGEFLNLTALLCGSRFGRGLVRPGGVRFDVEPERAREAQSRLDLARRDLAEAAGLLWESPSVLARFEDTGRLSREEARSLGLVGVAARACGLERDARQEFPWGIYRFSQIPISVMHAGDVLARAHVRWLEIERSAAFLRDQLRSLPAGPVRAEAGGLAPDRLAVSLVEGWRGEICHVALTDARGRFAAYKVVDPSFHNWTGLALALRGQAISDFPLCNKSFDLSYCGFDL